MGKLDGAKVLVTGATGFLGRFVCREITKEGGNVTPVSKSLGFDLRNEAEVLQAIVYDKPDIIVHLAATVGGIGDNMARPATFFRDNILMGLNVVHSAAIAGCKLVNIGTTCFPARTSVRTGDGSYKEIQDIVAGDKVVSSTGHVRSVNKIFSRKYSGTMIHIRPKGMEEITCTPEHPFLTQRGWITANRLNLKDELYLIHSKLLKADVIRLIGREDQEELDLYKEVISGKYKAASGNGKTALSAKVRNWRRGTQKPRLITDIPEVEVPLAGDLAWLCGAYLADGFRSQQTETKRGRGTRNAVYITPGFDHEAVEKMADIFLATWGVRPSVKKTRTSLRLEIGHRIACDFFSSFYISNEFRSATKRVPEFVMRSSLKAKADFIRGYWQGDGYVGGRRGKSDSHYEQAVLASSSVSRTLCLQIRDILSELGIWSGIYKRSASQQNHTIEGRDVSVRDSWQIRVTGPSALRMVGLLNGEDPIPEDHNSTRVSVPIRSLKSSHVSCVEVYNISVEEDESYIVDGLAVHNCSYAKFAKPPFREEDFWSGFPEETNAPYGIAKKAIHTMCQAYRKQFGLHYAYLVPANMYGPNDSFDEKTSHVIPAMIRRFVEAAEARAPEVTCWGTGKATRSFLYVEDAAKAIAAACAELDSDEVVNLPGSDEISMKGLATIVGKLVKFSGEIQWDATKPDGQPRRALDGSRARSMLGWAPETPLVQGLEATISWYLESRKGRTT